MDPYLRLGTSHLEQTVADVGQSTMQLLNAQQSTNHNLQQKLNQSAPTQQHQVDTLPELTASNYDRNFNHMFASILIFDGSKKEDSFEKLKRLKAVCLQSGKDIRVEVLWRSRGTVRNCLLSMPWTDTREELK